MPSRCACKIDVAQTRVNARRPHTQQRMYTVTSDEQVYKMYLCIIKESGMRKDEVREEIDTRFGFFLGQNDPAERPGLEPGVGYVN